MTNTRSIKRNNQTRGVQLELSGEFAGTNATIPSLNHGQFITTIRKHIYGYIFTIKPIIELLKYDISSLKIFPILQYDDQVLIFSFSITMEEDPNPYHVVLQDFYGQIIDECGKSTQDTCNAQVYVKDAKQSPPNLYDIPDLTLDHKKYTTIGERFFKKFAIKFSNVIAKTMLRYLISTDHRTLADTPENSPQTYSINKDSLPKIFFACNIIKSDYSHRHVVPIKNMDQIVQEANEESLSSIPYVLSSSLVKQTQKSLDSWSEDPKFIRAMPQFRKGLGSPNVSTQLQNIMTIQSWIYREIHGPKRKPILAFIVKPPKSVQQNGGKNIKPKFYEKRLINGRERNVYKLDKKLVVKKGNGWISLKECMNSAKK